MALPRGVRSHNPGNIEYQPANKWQGLAEPATDGRFCRFKSEVWGLRALCVLLITYYDRYDCDTVAKIIARWAPNHENPTDAYAAHVAKRVGVDPEATINLHDYATLNAVARGIVTFENGPAAIHGRPADWYPDETYAEALRRAGVIPQGRTPKDMTDAAQTATVATVGVAGAMEVGGRLLGATSERAQYMGAMVLVAAVAISGLAYYRHRKQRRAEKK